MPPRFQTALEQALDDVRSRPGVTGVLFFGSAMTGTAGPTSDLDLYVLLTDDQTQTQISLCRYAGVEAEVHYAPVRVWRERLEAGKAVTLTAFATGQALLDPQGAVAELKALARHKLEEGPKPLTPFEVDRWRYHLTDLAGDLEDVAGQPADERLVGARLVTLSLEAYCALHGLWGDKAKRTIAYVERHDPELGRLVRTYFAGDLDRHLAQAVVDHVLAPFGGRLGVWEFTDQA